MPRTQPARGAALRAAVLRRARISYTETSLARSFADIVAYLNQVGIAARDPFSCPLVGQLRAV